MFSESTIIVMSGESKESEEVARLLADRFRVIEVESADQGMTQISGDVGAIVLDLDSARPAALDMLRRTRQERHSPPILAVTGGDDVNAAVEAMKLGASDCLVKPVKAEELYTAIAELLDKRRANNPPGGDQPLQIDIPPGTSLEELERVAVEQALIQHHGNRTHAAKTLGISVRTLQRKLKAWGMPIMSAPLSSRSGHFIMPSSGGNTAYSVHIHSAH